MHQIGLSTKKISADAISNSWRASKEGSHATLTPLGRFYAFAGRAEGISDPGGEIILVLGKADTEL